MALSGDKRFVLLASSNAHKVAEYESLLSLYGINVQQCEPRVFKDYGELGKGPYISLQLQFFCAPHS